jgi:hypothetical protein
MNFESEDCASPSRAAPTIRWCQSGGSKSVVFEIIGRISQNLGNSDVSDLDLKEVFEQGARED